MRKYVSRWSGAFRTPARMMQRLEELLAGEVYKVQAVMVATMVLRVWCSPDHIGKPFPLSRGEVAAKLGLKDWETRKAVELLVKVGFLSAEKPKDNKPRVGKNGIRRPPILYRLCSVVLSYFRRLLAKRSGAVAPVSNLSDEKISSPKGLFTGGGSLLLRPEVPLEIPAPGIERMFMRRAFGP